jgi:hypothetical protein
MELMTIDDVRRRGEMLTPSTDPKFASVRALDSKHMPCSPTGDDVFMVTPAGLMRRMKVSMQTCRMMVASLKDAGILVTDQKSDVDDLIRHLHPDDQAQLLANALLHGIYAFQQAMPGIQA